MGNPVGIALTPTSISHDHNFLEEADAMKNQLKYLLPSDDINSSNKNQIKQTKPMQEEKRRQMSNWLLG